MLEDSYVHPSTHAHIPDKTRAYDEAGDEDCKIESAGSGAACEQAFTEALRWVLPVEGFGQGFGEVT